ncbi:MAG: Fic family protein [Chloroflexota bacterium]|nr:Fic family protein [Chloroflexota bacterium]
MSWEPITDLPDDWRSMVSTEVESLAHAWDDNYQQLKDTPMLLTFNERLRREWSIETGVIERLYTIDRGTTQLLIEQGIDSAYITHGATDRPVNEVLQLIRDQREALDGLFAFVSNKSPLSLHYIRSLHQVLLRHQNYTEALNQFGSIMLVSIAKGEWKKQPNNPQRLDGSMHEYAPPEQTASEMDQLIMLHNQHRVQHVSPQVESAWLHHRFTQIHPFQDGNGRVARCLATIVLLREGRFPLVINRDQRIEYIAALEEADAGDLTRLVRLFDHIEKQAYLHALDLSSDVLGTRAPIAGLIDGIVAGYRKHQQQRYDQVLPIAEQLQQIAKTVLEVYANTMQLQFQQSNLPVLVRVLLSSPQTTYWYQGDIIQTARKIGYSANLTRPRLWVRLRIQDEQQLAPLTAEIVVSFHYVGKEDRGVMIATAFLNITHKPDSPNENVVLDVGDRDFREMHPLVSEGFIFTYTDTVQAEARELEFRKWLDRAIAAGLAEWQKQL